MTWRKQNVILIYLFVVYPWLVATSIAELTLLKKNYHMTELLLIAAQRNQDAL